MTCLTFRRTAAAAVVAAALLALVALAPSSPQSADLVSAFPVAQAGFAKTAGAGG